MARRGDGHTVADMPGPMLLHDVVVGPRNVAAYEGVVPPAQLADVRARAEPLRGLRVLHLSATPYGGGVSELLRSTVPLLRALGIDAEWKVITGDPQFFEATKTIHNALQGSSRGLDDAQREAYLQTSEANAEALDDGWDVVVAHDPQTAAMRAFSPDADARWVWRCHIDTSAPNPEVWAFLRPYLEPFDAAVFTMEEFVPPDFPVADLRLIPPAIDPLNPKNLRLPDTTARQVLGWIGVDLGRPLMTQVSRFDPWKDPFGVVEAYRLVREEVPGLQLAMVGAMALDDPEAWDLHRRLQDEAAHDPLIRVFTNLTGVGNIEVNAFQRLSNVVVQKSIREGFGLVVSEAMWKGTPVVAGRAGGIPMQVGDGPGAGGVLVDGVEVTARAVTELLLDPDRAEKLGARGRRRVRARFLISRLVSDWLALFGTMVGSETAAARLSAPAVTGGGS